MSKVVKAAIPLAFTIVGGIIGGPIGAAIGAAIGSVVAAVAFKPKAPSNQAQTVSLDLGEVGREAVFGLALTGGSLGDGFNYGGKYGTDWEVLPIMLADHLCDALVGFYVGDKYVPYTGNGIVPGFNGQLKITWHQGTESQAADATLVAHGGWATTDTLSGVCYAVVEYKSDASDAKNPVWSAGRPRFSFLVRGKRCYQARKDSTVAGGSGPHRWTVPSTWEWTDNPIDCRYNWVRGIYACDRIGQPGQLLVGRGLSAIEAPPERVAAQANICDEAVALAGGGSEKRYRTAAVINALQTYDTIEDRFAKACAGIVIQPQGSIEIEPGHAKAPVAYITDDDLVIGKPVTFSDFRSEADDAWCNTVIPRYIEPTQRWLEHGAPIRRASADLIVDGGPRELTLQLDYVTSGRQAQRCGEIVRRMGRLLRTAGFTLGPRFSELEEGDWIVYTSARRTHGLPVAFRIEAFSLDEARQNTLSLREMNAAVFTWSTAAEIADGSTAEAQTPPDGYGVPDIGAWTLAGASIGADGATLPSLVFTGAVEDMYVSSVRFEIRVHDAANGPNDNWTGTTLAPAAITSRSIGEGVIGNQSYDGAVSYSFPGGTYGERLVLGPVTAGTLSVARAVHTVVSQSVPYPIDSSNASIDIAAYAIVIDDGRSIGLPAGSITGLAGATTYAVLWDIDDEVYLAAAFPALAYMASSDYAFLGWSTTSNAGVYPPEPTAPGGWGGGGSNCVVVETAVLMANAAHDGPGGTKAAGAIDPDTDWVWTQHEITRAWGAYRVRSARCFVGDVFRALGKPRATGSHPFGRRDGWVRMDAIGRPDGRAEVVHLVVNDAQTFVSIEPDGSQVLNHNKREAPSD